MHKEVSRPHHACEERVWGHCRPFLGLAHHDVIARAPIQTYANNHMTTELAEPRISTQTLSSFWGWSLGTSPKEREREGGKVKTNKGLQFHAHLAIVISGLIFPH